MLQHACGLTQEQLLADHADQLPKPAAHELNRLLTRRADREPLAYILGEREFYRSKIQSRPTCADPTTRNRIAH